MVIPAMFTLFLTLTAKQGLDIIRSLVDFDFEPLLLKLFPICLNTDYF